MGFKEAGCKVVFMNDLDKDACKTLEANFDIQPQQGDIKEGLENVPSADIVEGGFPCQGFSVAGPRKQTKNKNSKINDERNILYRYLKKTILGTNPKFFVAENVKGLVTIGENPEKAIEDEDGNWEVINRVTEKRLKYFTGSDAKKEAEKYVRDCYGGPYIIDGEIIGGKIAQGIKKDLENIGNGYKVYWKILNAKDFGIPQERERIFIVGVRKDLDYEFKFPKPTHGPDCEEDYVTLETIKKIRVKDEEIFREKKEHQDDYFGSRYMSRNRVKDWKEQSFTITADAMHVPAMPGCKMWNTSDGKPPGGKKPKDSEWTEFRKEHADKISPDLVRLSWRQCAAIQGFPLDYDFKGKDVKSFYRQIGNAVPPLLMQRIAECIMPFYDGKKSSY